MQSNSLATGGVGSLGWGGGGEGGEGCRCGGEGDFIFSGFA